MSDEELFDFDKDKKKPKRNLKKKEVKEVADAVVKTEGNTYADPNKYEDMLDRIFKILKQGKTTSSDSK